MHIQSNKMVFTGSSTTASGRRLYAVQNDRTWSTTSGGRSVDASGQ